MAVADKYQGYVDATSADVAAEQAEASSAAHVAEVQTTLSAANADLVQRKSEHGAANAARYAAGVALIEEIQAEIAPLAPPE